MKANIYIFSQAVRSGKTTLLAGWRRQLHSCGGILSPDIDGVRVLQDLRSGELIPFELSGESEPTIKIGRFVFSRKAFSKAGEILQREAMLDPDWLVIDEIGKLEVQQNEGFEPWASWLISKYKNADRKGRLLLVVRDQLLQETIDKYQLNDAVQLKAGFFQ